MAKIDWKKKTQEYADSIIPIAKTYEEENTKRMLRDAYLAGCDRK